MDKEQKKILIDLEKLKNLNCGLGQVALNYGAEISKINPPSLVLNLLVPKNFLNFYGGRVKYIKRNLINRHFPFLNPKFDLWHATHQLSRFTPGNKSTPYLLTIHDFNFMYEKEPQKAQQYLEKIQKKVDRACMIVAISNFVADEIRKFINLKGKEIRVIHNGVKFNEINHLIKPDFIKIDRPFFFTIGQVVEKKNFHTLLDTMKFFPETDLYICGETIGKYAHGIKSRIENELIKNVKLTGSISSEEKNWLYHNCKAFVFPSKFEGFGLPVIEAMQCGKPVFSSNMTSLKEIGNKYAYFWENFEPEYMANVIKEGLIDFDLKPQIQIDEIEYAMGFSYEKNVKAYLDLYKEILGI